MSTRWVQLHDLGLLPYGEAMRWQEAAAGSLRAGGAEALALLEHPPVYSRGVRAEPAELLVPPAELEARGAAIVASDRGGRTTFHGPGQLVLYPVLDLRARGLGPADYVRRLEAIAVHALADLGIAGERVDGRPGVWVGGAKIASVGVRVRRGVTSHGLALNVSNDLSWFDLIAPCGLVSVRMTSVGRLLGGPPRRSVVVSAVRDAFERLLDSRLMPAEATATAAEPAPTW